MGIWQIILGIVALLIGIALIVIIMMQDAKNSNMSGVVTGNSDSYMGSGKGASKEKKLTRLTTILSIAFAVVILALNLAVIK